MLSYTGQRNLFGELVRSSAAANLTIADTLINQRRKVVLAARQWWFLEKEFTLTTAASTQNYAIPGQVERLLSSPYITVGSTRYTPRECPSRDYWNMLNETSYTSDFPEWWFLSGTTLSFFPTPASASNTITLNAKQRVIDLSVADYTTGTITSITNGATAVVGATTSWTTGMAGKWLKITSGNAANLGDDTWYQISSVGGATTITLNNAYGGTSLSSATANYTIGQMSILPDAYDELPLYLALQTYFTSIDHNDAKAAMYASMAKDLYTQMATDHSNRTGGRVVDEGLVEEIINNPNLHITL